MDNELVKLKFHDDFKDMMESIDYQSMIDAVSYFMYSVADGDISTVIELVEEVDSDNFRVLYPLGEIKYIDINNSITIIPNKNLIELLTECSIDDLRIYPMLNCTKSNGPKVYKVDSINNFICVKIADEGNNNELIKLKFYDDFKDGVPDKNGRIWNLESVRKAIDDYNKSRAKVLQFSNPNITYIDMNSVICDIKEVNFDDKSITILSNDKFKEIIKDLSLKGLRVYPRGWYKKTNGDEHYEMEKIVSFSIVNNINQNNETSKITIQKESNNE